MRAPDDWVEEFTRGRAQFLAFIVPAQSLAACAGDLLERLDAADLLAPSIDEHLHVTLRGLGFQVIEKTRPDDVLRQDVGRIGEAAAVALRGAAPIELRAGPINVFPDALVLEVHPPEPLRELRTRIATAAPGDDALSVTEETYLPHVTIATFAKREAGALLRERIAALRDEPPVAFDARRVEFVRHWFTGLDPDLSDRDVIRSYALRG